MRTSKNRLAAILFLLIGFLFATIQLYAADVESGHDRQAILEGAKQMLEGNKTAVGILAKKGMKDPELISAEKMMLDGYDLVVKGESMMSGGAMAEGKDMVTRGANMMMAAEKATTTFVGKRGMIQECSLGLDMCRSGDAKMKAAFQTHGLHGDWEGQH